MSRVGHPVLSGKQPAEFLLGAGEFFHSRTHGFVGDGHVEIADGARGTRMVAGNKPARVAGDDDAEAVVLVIVGFGVFVDKDQRSAVKQVAVPFGRCFEAAE